MVYHDMASYLWVKGQTYYFNRRVPKDVQAHYKASRIVICLKTSRKDQAIRAAKSIAQRLEDYWMSLRLANLDVPALHLLRDRLRAVQCPSDMIDQIGGWSTAGVGQSYGEGYDLLSKSRNLALVST